jgi:beta-1,4-glucosyltransferase
LPNKFIRIGGFAISDCCFENVTRRIYSQIHSEIRLAVFFANTHFVVTCQPLRNRLPRMSSSVLILNDGIGVSIARRLLRRGKFADNMNGTDFVPRLLRDSPKPLRVYLLGSNEKAVDGTAAAFGQIPHVDIVGLCDGYSLWQKEDAVIEEINDARPDILLVAMGCPLQECWIVENFDRLNASAIFGVGALFDFVSGEAPRAPKVMRQARLEWLYRWWREPRRLSYRYTIEIVSFFRIVFANAVDTVQTSIPTMNRHMH